ncbi:MAG: hypothetical protein IPO93_04355 [Actinobacteria bacterium]|nr:hypothetical protein [Actinomycetota bacterium]
MTNTRTTTRDPGSSSRQPAPSNTPGTGRIPDGPTTTGCALQATSRIHNRAGITMLVVAARHLPATTRTLIRVRVFDCGGGRCGA